MKTKRIVAAVSLITLGLAGGQNLMAQDLVKQEPEQYLAALEPGEWTQCVADSKGRRFNIVNGGGSVQACHALARRCTGDPSVSSTHYSTPVIIEAPYIRCDLY